MERKKVFICSPFRGDVEGNSAKAAGYCRRAYEDGCLPIAPHLLFPQFLNEDSTMVYLDITTEQEIKPFFKKVRI